MGIFAGSLIGRWIFATAIGLGIILLLLGELYLIAVFLGSRIWLTGKVGKVVVFLFEMLAIAVFLFPLYSFLMPRLFTPQPSSMGYILNGLLFSFLALNSLPASGVATLISRLTFPSVDQPPPAPAIKWARLLWEPLLGLFLGLALGLWIGWLIGWLLPYLPFASADAALPLFQRGSVLFMLGFGGTLGLAIGLSLPFDKRMAWWKKYLPRERFPRIGASLIVTGSVIIALAAWLTA